MNRNVYILLGVFVFVAFLLLSDFGNSKTVIVYDCSLVEQQSDTPDWIREECQRLRKDAYEKNIKPNYI